MARLDIEMQNLDYNSSFQPTVWTKEDSNAIIGEFPPGNYYIGDLFMIMNKEIYKGIWGDIFNYKDGVYTSCNGNFAMYYAANKYLVGSNKFNYTAFGTIGICSKELCVNNIQNASYHEFREPVKFVFSKRGFTFASGDWSLYIDD